MTLRDAWRRSAAIVAGVGIVISIAGAGYAVDAWASQRVTAIVQREVPTAVDAELGGVLTEIRDSLRESRDEDALLRAEVRALRRMLLDD